MAKNIMICDDAAFMRMMIKDILSKNGYNIAAEAENGAVAVEKYKEVSPDLVLMDITMPEMDGIQALKSIKAYDPNASIIMCSAMGQQAMVIEAIQSGAKDFIVKPFQADRVLEAVKKVVGQYEYSIYSGINQSRKESAGTGWSAHYFCLCSFDYIFDDEVDGWIPESKIQAQEHADSGNDFYWK